MPFRLRWSGFGPGKQWNISESGSIMQENSAGFPRLFAQAVFPLIVI